MGCYGIGVSRTVAAAIEQNHDQDGIIFPMPMAPFQVVLLNLALKDERAVEASDSLYVALQQRGIDVLYDDRDERPGSKFKDADLIGIPLRVMIGKRFLEDGTVEIKLRSGSELKTVAFEEALQEIAAMCGST